MKYIKKFQISNPNKNDVKNYPAIVSALSVIYTIEINSTAKATLLSHENAQMKIIEFLDECEI